MKLPPKKYARHAREAAERAQRRAQSSQCMCGSNSALQQAHSIYDTRPAPSLLHYDEYDDMTTYRLVRCVSFVVFSNMYLVVYYPLPTLRTHVLTHSTIGRGWDKKKRNENGRRYDGHTTCFKVTHATATTSRHAFTITLVVVLFCQHLRAYCEVGV